jgi:hypothetical protein
VNRFQRSFALLSESLAVVRAERSLLLFPVLSAVFTVLAMIIILVPGIAFVSGSGDGTPLPFLVLSLLAGYAATVIATYFNVALVSCAAASFHGEQTSISDGLGAANRRLGSILVWALIATAVGAILRALEERAGFLGSIVVSLLGAGWAVATYFVIPVLAFEQVGPGDALRRSVATVRRSWGESLIGNVGLGIATFVLMIPVLLLGAAAVAVMGSVPAAGVLLLVVAGTAMIALVVVTSALGQVYKTAVYLYAANGEVVGFSKDLLDGAFRSK